MPETTFHPMTDGRRVAFRHLRGTGPALVFLPGYMSDMAGSRAGINVTVCAVALYAAETMRTKRS